MTNVLIKFEKAGPYKTLVAERKMFSHWLSTLKVTVTLTFSVNILIIHRLRNKFLQIILISLDSASWELHQYPHRMCGPMKNPEVETLSRDSNSRPYDCKADALFTTTDTTLAFTFNVLNTKSIGNICFI